MARELEDIVEQMQTERTQELITKGMLQMKLAESEESCKQK